jgi:hypothetical protein
MLGILFVLGRGPLFTLSVVRGGRGCLFNIRRSILLKLKTCPQELEIEGPLIMSSCVIV